MRLASVFTPGFIYLDWSVLARARAGGRRGRMERRGGQRCRGAPCKGAALAPFTASSTGAASVCPHIVGLTRGEKKLTKSQIK